VPEVVQAKVWAVGRLTGDPPVPVHRRRLKIGDPVASREEEGVGT
jgi:hypothetical protein